MRWRHVDRGDALFAQPHDQLVQPVGLVLRQAARRLVEDDDAGAAADRRRDLHHLLLADGQLADDSMDVDVGADGREHLARRLAHPGATTNVRRRGQRAETEVLGDRQVLAERELLMDDADAGGERLLRSVKATRAPDNYDVPGVGLIDAGEDLAERALAGAVLAAQRVAASRRRSRS